MAFGMGKMDWVIIMHGDRRSEYGVRMPAKYFIVPAVLLALCKRVFFLENCLVVCVQQGWCYLISGDDPGLQVKLSVVGMNDRRV